MKKLLIFAVLITTSFSVTPNGNASTKSFEENPIVKQWDEEITREQYIKQIAESSRISYFEARKYLDLKESTYESEDIGFKSACTKAYRNDYVTVDFKKGNYADSRIQYEVQVCGSFSQISGVELYYSYKNSGGSYYSQISKWMAPTSFPTTSLNAEFHGSFQHTTTYDLAMEYQLAGYSMTLIIGTEYEVYKQILWDHNVYI